MSARKFFQPQTGQALSEYALLLVVIAIVATATLVMLGPQINDTLQQIVTALGRAPTSPTSVRGIANDFLDRINTYYQAHNTFPRSWGDYRFADLGLNPTDWANAVEGIFWNPNGDKIGLANRAGDNLQIYVNDLQGNRLHLYDGWNIWCTPTNRACYYHTVAPENQINLDTLQVVKQ